MSILYDEYLGSNYQFTLTPSGTKILGVSGNFSSISIQTVISGNPIYQIQLSNNSQKYINDVTNTISGIHFEYIHIGPLVFSGINFSISTKIIPCNLMKFSSISSSGTVTVYLRGNK